MIEPMLVRSPKPGELETILDSPHWVAEEKFDGARYLMQVKEGRVHFLSRRQSKVSAEQVDKASKVPQIVLPLERTATKKYSIEKLEGTILDGELMPPGHRPQTASEVFKGENVGHQLYMVFDCLSHCGENVMDLPLHERRQRAIMVLAYIDSWLPDVGRYMGLVRQECDDKREYGEEVLARGGEGLILKWYKSLYVPGSRQYWVKWKAVDTFDCVITGYDLPSEWYAEPGQRGADGVLYTQGRKTRFWENEWIGAVVFGQYQNGKLVEVGRCSGMDDTMREYITKHQKELLGEVIEVKAQERSRSKDGTSLALRHPRFVQLRFDKNPKDCVVE